MGPLLRSQAIKKYEFFAEEFGYYSGGSQEPWGDFNWGETFSDECLRMFQKVPLTAMYWKIEEEPGYTQVDKLGNQHVTVQVRE